MTDILEQLRDQSLQLARRSFDSVDAGLAANVADAAIDEIERLRGALTECIDTLSLVERPRMVDPDYGVEVNALGKRIGFGALMSSASASWRHSLAADGDPVGGEFVAGPCFATVIATLKKARAALPSKDRS